MTKEEALKLTLEALEGVLDDSSKVLEASISGGLYEVIQCREAIAAGKKALAQPEHITEHFKRKAVEFAAKSQADPESKTKRFFAEAYAGYARTAQPEQELVATVIKRGGYRQWGCIALSQLPDGTYTFYSEPHQRQPQPEERNFCPRCGKRTADPTTIHTCTPPQENA